MAGAFTHFIISDAAKRKGELLGTGLMRILNKYSQFLFLGSVSPDLPYLSFKTGKTNWADCMHYEKTNLIVELGFGQLKNRVSDWQDSDELSFVWLMGYVSHLVADVTIHPIVEAIVGPYAQNKARHCACEMAQDSLIFFKQKNIDITYAEFIDIPRFCRNHAGFDELLKFWKGLARKAYARKDNPNPRLWFDTYTTALDTIDGSEIAAFFRHLGLGKRYLYKTAEEIRHDFPQDYQDYYANVKLPGGNIGTFLEDGFERSVKNVVDAWNRLYEGLRSPFVVADVIKNWNLDTGIDALTNVMTYWG